MARKCYLLLLSVPNIGLIPYLKPNDGNVIFQPAVGPFPWGPVLDRNFTKPGDSWYHGWKERDWHFLNRTPEELIKHGHFNRGLSYMSGVTTQEAAYIICKQCAKLWKTYFYDSLNANN